MGVAAAQEMNQAVTDTSVLFKTLIAEPDSGLAGAFVASSVIAVPDLVYAEVGNAVWTRVHDGRLTERAAVELLEEFTLAALQVHSSRPHIVRAIAIAAAIDHPVYDCIFLALAESLDVPLVTEDKRFLKALSRRPLQTTRVKRLADVA